MVKAPDKLTTEKEKRLGGLKEESEQLLQEIKGMDCVNFNLSSLQII